MKVGDIKMNLEEFLEKYNCTMNIKDIDKIEDINIINIKKKYSALRQKAFLDEYNIPDKELENVFNKLDQEEKETLEEYFKTIY